MPRLDLPQEFEAAQLAYFAAQFAAGHKNALFKAIGFCGNQGLPMPEWIVTGFSTEILSNVVYGFDQAAIF